MRVRAVLLSSFACLAPFPLHAQALWPSPRTGGHVLAFDAERRSLVLIGGDGARQDQTRDSTWIWSGAWSVAPADGPGWRTLPAIAWDSRRRRLVLHGGRAKTGQRAYAPGASSDTWAWDGVRWQQLQATGTGPIDHHAMVYDAARDMLVLQGGADGGRILPGSTWGFNGSEWRELAGAAGGPGERVHHAMAYDTRRQRVVLYGGFGSDESQARRGETWEWDATRWTRMATTGPGPRARHRMAYDEVRGVTLLFGGNDDPRTWAWNGTEWRVVAEQGPRPRSMHAMTYDAARGRVMLFGGTPGGDELWEWDGSSWEELPRP